MLLGLKRGTVILTAHREEWHQLFAEEKALVLDVIREHVISIEHVGSTAICGIVAKPILDIMVGVAKFEDGEKCVRGLEDLGYEYKGENGVPRRHFFGKGVPRTHHLHMVVVESDFWKYHILFRDHLRHNKSAAKAYNDLKRTLAQCFSDNREAYTNGKAAFVDDIIREQSRSETR
jgi:GrpB-like predicted nucleotidyltransferase (UPF0157 family)